MLVENQRALALADALSARVFSTQTAFYLSSLKEKKRPSPDVSELAAASKEQDHAAQSNEECAGRLGNSDEAYSIKDSPRVLTGGASW